MRSLGIVACACLIVAAPVHAEVAVDAQVAQRVRSLDCGNLSPKHVAETLANVPAPRIIALQGSVPIVTMAPLLAFLEHMGYPADRLDQAGGNRRARSSFVEARRIAGEMAWHYERDALMPILLGHSQGGMVVIGVLHELAGTKPSSPLAVWAPDRDVAEDRTSVVDPYTGQQRAIVGLRVDFASAFVTGSLPRVVLGQWGMLPLLREVPDSVREFTGFAIPWDPIAGTGAEPAPYRSLGVAQVRNVVLPASYSHIGLPRAEHLAAQPATRGWIDAYRPGSSSPIPQDADTTNLLIAAELWHSIRRHWCEGAKRLVDRPVGRAPVPAATVLDERNTRAAR